MAIQEKSVSRDTDTNLWSPHKCTCNMCAHGKRESSLNHPGSHPEAQACFLNSPTMGTECLHLSSLLRSPHAGLRALAAHTLLLGSIPSIATLTLLFTVGVKAVLSMYIPSFEPQTQTFPFFYCWSLSWDKLNFSKPIISLSVK